MLSKIKFYLLLNKKKIIDHVLIFFVLNNISKLNFMINIL